MNDAVRAGVTWECDESRADDPDHEWDDNPIGSRYVRFTAVIDNVEDDLVELTVTRSNPHHASPEPGAEIAKSAAQMRSEAKWQPYSEPTPEGNTETHVADEDCVIMADGGTHQGRTFEDEVEAQLGDTQTSPMAGGVAIDLVTRQPLFVRRVKYEDLREHYRAEGYNLLTYKTHPYLPVTADDRVFECVYVNGDPERAHKPGETYDFPEGRLMHFPVEQAWDGDGDA